mgnify:CR=1 FL=1
MAEHLPNFRTFNSGWIIEVLEGKGARSAARIVYYVYFKDGTYAGKIDPLYFEESSDFKTEKSEEEDFFYLIDYKGKLDIIKDEVNNYEYKTGIITGKITKEQAIEEAEERKEKARAYGVPPYIGEDEEMKKVFNN